MSRFCFFAAAALLISSQLAFAESPPPAGATVAKVNGVAITEDELSAAKTELSEALEGLPEAARREQLIDYMITLKLLSGEARKEKLDGGSDYAARIAFLTDKMLMETLLRREIDKTVTKKAIEAFYNEKVKTMEPEMEVHARHILLPSEEEAKSVIAELKAGKDFAELAKSLSKDPGSAKEGGDLGYFTKDRMVPELSEVAFKAEVGKLVPEPVKSQFGWHVIKIEDRRKQPTPPLSEVEGQVRNFLIRKAQADLVAKLRDSAKIEKPEAPSDEKPKN